MRQWSLGPDSPLSLILASDARLASGDDIHDHVWELALGWRAPAALLAETTYGLRAQAMRIYPSFRWKSEERSEVNQFHSPPIVRRILPNYVLLDFSPFRGVRARCEYWAASGSSLAGRIEVQGAFPEASPLMVRMHGSLVPREPGQALGEAVHEGVRVLSGRTEDLAPVLFVSGGAQVQATHTPALALERPLAADRPLVVLWATSANRGEVDSFREARAVTRLSWEEQIARVELVNSSLVDISTGDEARDIALHLAQVSALQAFVSRPGQLPASPVVEVRDRGSGPASNGTEGPTPGPALDQSLIQAEYLIGQILPGEPELAKRIIHNFIHTQKADGRISGQTAFAGRRPALNAPPLLADCAWRVYLCDGDGQFLEQIYARLSQFFASWIDPVSDRDQDGVPEWLNTLQAGYPDWPTFVRWHRWGENFDIQKAETGCLAGCLLSEATALAKMADVLGREDAYGHWRDLRLGLQAVLTEWMSSEGRLRHRDRDTHESHPGLEIGSLSGNGKLATEIRFDSPRRIVIRISADEQQAKQIEISLRGRARAGRFGGELIGAKDLEWYWHFGTYTSEILYQSVTSVHVRGAPQDAETEVFVPDLTGHDATQLLPLRPLAEEYKGSSRAALESLTDPALYWRPAGVPSIPASHPLYDTDQGAEVAGVRMNWNAHLVEALLNLGEGPRAAELILRLLDTISSVLRHDHSWRERYDGEQGQGWGRRNSTLGAAPFGAFLAVLGVHLRTPWDLDVRGAFHLEQPVRLRWKGLEVQRTAHQTVVTFPNGYSVETAPTGDHRIVQDRGD